MKIHNAHQHRTNISTLHLFFSESLLFTVYSCDINAGPASKNLLLTGVCTELCAASFYGVTLPALPRPTRFQSAVCSIHKCSAAQVKIPESKGNIVSEQREVKNYPKSIFTTSEEKEKKFVWSQE